MKKIFLILSLFTSSLAAGFTSEETLHYLMDGNQRYIDEVYLHRISSSKRRLETTEGQEPIATVLCCSDSRVSPEIIFDQGLGDLFVVRVAGNILGDTELDSIAYSTLYLHSPLVVVLGHANCGAVEAVLSGNTKDIETIASLIEPALKHEHAKNVLERAIQDNVNHVVSQLKSSRRLSRLLSQGKLQVVGGYYDLATGVVTLL